MASSPLERALSNKREDPNELLAAAIQDFLHVTGMPVEARSELENTLRLISEQALVLRSEPSKPKLLISTKIFALKERFSAPEYTPYVIRIEQAARQIISLGETEQKIRDEKRNKP